MIETLFVSNSTRRSSKSGTKGPNSSLCSQENKVLDPKKSQVQNYLWIFFLITGRHVAYNNILLETQNVLLRKHFLRAINLFLLATAVPLLPNCFYALTNGLVGGARRGDQFALCVFCGQFSKCARFISSASAARKV